MPTECARMLIPRSLRVSVLITTVGNFALRRRHVTQIIRAIRDILRVKTSWIATVRQLLLVIARTTTLELHAMIHLNATRHHAKTVLLATINTTQIPVLSALASTATSDNFARHCPAIKIRVKTVAPASIWLTAHMLAIARITTEAQTVKLSLRHRVSRIRVKMVEFALILEPSIFAIARTPSTMVQTVRTTRLVKILM